jgi:predicted RNA polymerase sigma factor
VTATDTHRAIDAVWRIESARLIAGLARMVRDIGRAEDLAAFVFGAVHTPIMRRRRQWFAKVAVATTAFSLPVWLTPPAWS